MRGGARGAGRRDALVLEARTDRRLGDVSSVAGWWTSAGGALTPAEGRVTLTLLPPAGRGDCASADRDGEVRAGGLLRVSVVGGVMCGTVSRACTGEIGRPAVVLAWYWLRIFCAGALWWRWSSPGCAGGWSGCAGRCRLRGRRLCRRGRPVLGSFGRGAGRGCSARGCSFRWIGQTPAGRRSRWR